MGNENRILELWIIKKTGELLINAKMNHIQSTFTNDNDHLFSGLLSAIQMIVDQGLTSINMTNTQLFVLNTPCYFIASVSTQKAKKTKVLATMRQISLQFNQQNIDFLSWDGSITDLNDFYSILNSYELFKK